MNKAYLKFVGITLACLVFFAATFFGADAAYPVTVTADIPSRLQWAKDYVKQVAWTSAKKGAMDKAMSQVTASIGGGAGGPKFITDWRDALQTQPEKATQVQMQNLFTFMGSGSGSLSVSGSAGYVSGMLSGASKSVLNPKTPAVINMAEYGVNSPAEMFNGRNMRAFMTAYGSSGKIGNRIEATLFAQGQKTKFEETNRKLAEAQAVANGGYFSSVSGGKVVTPGATIRDLMASAQNMSFASLANAKTIQEVTGALVSRVVVNVAKRGIGSAGRPSGQGSSGKMQVELKGSFGDLSVGVR